MLPIFRQQSEEEEEKDEKIYRKKTKTLKHRS